MSCRRLLAPCSAVFFSQEEVQHVRRSLVLLPLTRTFTCSFTGSTRVGSIIAQTCGKYLKPVVLELGGKAPAIVAEEANLEL